MVAFATLPMEDRDFESATAMARAEAARRVRLGNFLSRDRDDVTQDLLVGVVARWPLFDSSRAKFSTFFSLVVRREATSLVRAKSAQKRGSGRNPESLDQNGRRECLFSRADADGDHALVDLGIDVGALVENLPPDVQLFAFALMRTGSITSAARSLKLSRDVAAAHAAVIRERLIEADLCP